MKRLFLIFFSFTFITSKAQVAISSTIPNSGILTRAQLWNVLLINNNTNTLNCKLEVVVMHKYTSIIEFTGSSNFFELKPGTMQTNSNVLMPITYNQANSTNLNLDNSFLPIGSYNICYKLLQLIDVTTQIAEECINVDIVPLSPPILTQPINNAELKTQPLNFTWVPPSPIALFNNLKYELNVVEVLQNQAPNEAIQYNIPFYYRNNLSNCIVNFEASTNNFEKNKTYAWQIVAIDNNGLRFYSEVNKFRLEDNKIDKIQKNVVFTVLSKNENKTELNIDEFVLPIKFYSDTKDYKIEFLILNSKEEVLQRIVKYVEYGDNYLYIDLNKDLQKNTTYKITTSNSFNNKLSSTFVIK